MKVSTLIQHLENHAHPDDDVFTIIRKSNREGQWEYLIYHPTLVVGSEEVIFVANTEYLVHHAHGEVNVQCTVHPNGTVT